MENLNTRQRLFIEAAIDAAKQISKAATMKQEGMGELCNLLRQNPDMAKYAARVTVNRSSDSARIAVEDCIKSVEVEK